jgi:hypothetical protein
MQMAKNAALYVQNIWNTLEFIALVATQSYAASQEEKNTKRHSMTYKYY